MAFNHYAKIKAILNDYEIDEWYIVKINEPTQTKKFNGELNYYSHYYRIYETKTNQPIPYCKFQQLDRLASVLKIDLPILELKIDQSK